MRPRDLLAVLSLFLLALAVRLIVLTVSTLPYNIDAFPLVRISEDMMATHHWELGGGGLMLYNSKMPAFSMILSAFSMVLGVEPLVLVRVLVPLIGSTSAVAVYMLALKVTGNRLAAYFAGLFLALSGFYLYLTTAIMKESLGLALMPVILYLFAERKDPRKRALAAVFLVLLPLIQHLTALIVFTAIGLMVIAENYVALKRKAWSARDALLDVLLGPALFSFTYAYYSNVRMEQFEKVVKFDEGILFLSVFLVLALFTVHLSRRAGGRPWFMAGTGKKRLFKVFDEKVLIIVIGIGLLLANRYLKVFAGTYSTSDDLLLLAAPYLVLIFVAFVGFNLIRYAETRYRSFVISIFMGALAVIAFGFLRGLDPFSMDLVYRSYDFMDVGIALCVGIGFAYLLGSSGQRAPDAKAPDAGGHPGKDAMGEGTPEPGAGSGNGALGDGLPETGGASGMGASGDSPADLGADRRNGAVFGGRSGSGALLGKGAAVSSPAGYSAVLKKGAAACLGFALVLATVPLAYSTEGLWGISDVTEERELKALEFLGGVGGGMTIGTDQRFADIANPYFGLEANGTMPWRFDQAASLGYDMLVIEDEWKSIGAQMYPFENRVIGEGEFDALLASTDVIYAGGSSDVVYVLRTGG